MNSTKRFHNICREIKRALGEKASYREILECAQLIISIYDRDGKEKEFLEEVPRTLDQKALYEIWEEEPWLIYFKESMREQFVDSEWNQIKAQYAI
jgi:hypothetical protein